MNKVDFYRMVVTILDHNLWFSCVMYYTEIHRPICPYGHMCLIMNGARSLQGNGVDTGYQRLGVLSFLGITPMISIPWMCMYLWLIYGDLFLKINDVLVGDGGTLLNDKNVRH